MFDVVFDVGPFWGPILEPFWAPSWPKIASSHLLNPRFLQKVDFQKNERHRGREHDFDPKTAPKTTQDRPKTAARRSSRAFFFRPRFRHRFSSVLGRNLASSWLPFGLQNRPKCRGSAGLNVLKTTLTSQDGPRPNEDRFKTDVKTYLFSFSFLTPILLRFGSPNAPILGPSLTPKRPLQPAPRHRFHIKRPMTAQNGFETA